MTKYKPAFNDLFAFEEHKVCGVSVEGETVTVGLKRLRKTGDCPCGERRCKVVEEFQRKVRDLSVSGKKCYVEILTYHISCKCGYYGIEKIDFLDKYSRYTKRFVQYVAQLCKTMSLVDVAEAANIDWKTAKRIDLLELEKLIISLDDVNPTGIGIDEIAYAKGHKYLTVVRKIGGGVIWIRKGRKKEVLDQFFKELGEEKCKKITVAVIDMWKPYIKSINENTNADIVFDKFHVIKKINEAVDKIRKEEFAKADPEEKLRMKKKRFLILKRGEKLNEYEKQSLQDLMNKNSNLYIAYLLKEQVSEVFEETDLDRGISRLERWIENVRKIGMEAFTKVLEMMESHWDGIVNYFKHHLTNAASEGFNRKINMIRRRACGYKDLHYFQLKILQTCQ